MIRITHFAQATTHNGRKVARIAHPSGLLIMADDMTSTMVEEVPQEEAAAPAPQAPQRPETAPRWDGPKDWQMQDGRGGYIIFDPKMNPREVMNIGLAKLTRWWKENVSGPVKVEEVIDAIEQRHKLSLGYWMSQADSDPEAAGAGNSRQSNYLRNKKMLVVLNVPDNILLDIAKEIANKFENGSVYVQFLGTPDVKVVRPDGSAYDRGKSYTPMSSDLGGFMILSPDKNERNDWRKRKVVERPGADGVPERNIEPQYDFSPSALMSSVKGWLTTFTQRVGLQRGIQNVTEDIEKKYDIKIMPWISPRGYGGYLEQGDGTVQRERPVLIKVKNIPNKALEDLARALARKFKQESVLVVFFDTNEKKVIHPDERQMEQGLMGGEPPTA